MSHYASGAVAPRTFTETETQRLLRVTGERCGAFRDHMILSVALATGLREHEIAALDMGDLYNERGCVRVRAVLRVFKRSNPNPAMQEVVLPGPLRAKLAKYRAWKEARGESVATTAPVFVSQKGARISTRQLRTLVHVWQVRAGFDRHLGFHALRHTACTGIYRRTKDIVLTQRFARHASLSSTLRYTHASDDDLARAVEEQAC
jgi:site-specific recombinase XerC